MLFHGAPGKETGQGGIQVLKCTTSWDYAQHYVSYVTEEVCTKYNECRKQKGFQFLLWFDWWVYLSWLSCFFYFFCLFVCLHICLFSVCLLTSREPSLLWVENKTTTTKRQKVLLDEANTSWGSPDWSPEEALSGIRGMQTSERTCCNRCLSGIHFERVPLGSGVRSGTGMSKELCESRWMPSTSVQLCAFCAFLLSTKFPATLGALWSLSCHEMLGCSNHLFFRHDFILLLWLASLENLSQNKLTLSSQKFTCFYLPNTGVCVLSSC